MIFRSFLQTHSKKAIKNLPFRKSGILLGITILLIFFLFLSSLGNAENVEVRNRDTISIQQTDLPDMDEDGLSDALENSLGTDNNSYYGDKDMDGLYDFEEYLDIYGTPDDTTDTPKYNYNDSTSYRDVLDIYHYFGLWSNKTAYFRDQNFTEVNSGFTDTLFWNVNFTTTSAGGGSGNVSYSNNMMINVNFAGSSSGGVFLNHQLSYNYNTMINVNFAGSSSGGSQGGGSVSYSNNIMTNVHFTGAVSGGSAGTVNFTNNLISDILLNVSGVAKSDGGTSIYMDNIIVSDRHDTDSDGLGDGHERFVIGTDPTSSDTDRDDLADGWEFIYNSSSGVNPLDKADTSELASDLDGDELNLTEEFKANTNPSSNDTDGDGLNDSYELNLTTDPTSTDTDGDYLADGWELRYRDVSGVNPLDKADTSELASDEDSDGLSLAGEENANTDPSSNDTDGDGLADGWEATYNGRSGVNPHVAVTDSELASDEDNDGLTLLEEEQGNTDPTSNDTDEDGLADKWEVTYNGSLGVNPFVAATASELDSDSDGDGLNISAEAIANTDPELNDTDGDGLNDGYEMLNLTTDPTLVDTDGDGLADKWEVTYNGTSGINPFVAATASELDSDGDSDGLTLLEEAKANTNPSSNDTDGDGLADGWEVRYNSSSGVNPLVAAMPSELASDLDGDDLNISAEAKANTDPESNDTDSDGLNDSYEVEDLMTDPTLADTDGDGLNDSYEVLILMTNASSVDTDGDGLNDKWEITYNGSSGVNPLVAATASELASDTDTDGLNLLEEAKANTDPGTADNPMSMNTTTSTTGSTDSAVSFSEISVVSSFVFLIMVGIFTSFSLFLVVYRVRRRIL